MKMRRLTLLAAAAIAALAASSAWADEWPLTFKRHLFGFVCFDTQDCSVRYGGYPAGDYGGPSPAFASIAPEAFDRIMVASYNDVPVSAPPAKVSWRAKDGTALTATVDVADIFKDGLIRHNVAQKDMAPASPGFTHVLILVVDRTVDVYTRTMIPTLAEQIPGNRYSFFRDDLIKVWSKTY